MALDFGDRSIYPNGSAYRAYYGLSALGAPNFAVGYGDIKFVTAKMLRIVSDKFILFLSCGLH